MDSNRLTRQAVRAAQRAARKADHPLTREEILSLRVQTVSPRKRLVFVLLGGGLLALAYIWQQSEFSPWIWVITGLAGLGLILFGLLGRKSTIDQQFRELGNIGADGVANAIFEVITSSLDGL